MYITQIISTIITIVVTAAVTAMVAALRNMTKRQTALDEGMQAVLRGEIIRSYYHYSGRGWITFHGLQAVELSYEAYHNLGGNGTVTKLVEDMRDLPVRESEDET